MISAILAFVSGTITFENPGIRLELFLKEMTKQTGTPFKCVAYLNNEVLAASFKDQSIDVLKTQLARVIHGTWEKKEESWWLIQTSEQKKEEQNWNRDQRYALYQWEIDQLRGYAPKTDLTRAEVQKYFANRKTKKEIEGPVFDEQPVQRRPLNLMEPGNRFQTRLATQLKPEFFDFEGLTRIQKRYTSQGLTGHAKIPIDVTQELASFVRESQLGVDLGVSTDEKVCNAVNFEIRQSSGEVPEFHITLYDRLWRYADSCWASLEIGATDLIPEGELFPLSLETQSKFKFSSRIDEFRYDHSRDSELKADPEYARCIDVLRDATKTDPLGLLQGRCWNDFAKSKNEPLLVNLEEDVYKMRPVKFVPKVDQTPIKLGMRRIDQEGWVLGRPKNPLYNRTWRLDRSIVETLTKLVILPNFFAIENQVRLDDIERYSFTVAHGVPNEKFLIGYESRGNGPFCVLGTLTPDQLRSCIQGAKIPVNLLPERAKVYLQDLAANGNLDELSPLITKGEWSTPVYCLPNGLQGMMIGASETQVPVVAYGKDPTAEVVPIYRYAYDMKKAIETNSDKLNDPIQLAYQTALSAEVHLGDRVVTQTVSEPNEGERLLCTWKTLPESVRSQVLAVIRQ